MARAFHLVSLAPNLVESFLVTGQGRTEEYIAELDRRGPAQPLPFSPKALGRVLEQIGRGGKPIVFVLSSKSVSIRKVQFPFDHPRRIAEALEFELENELLGRLDQYLYAYKVHPQPDKSALVMAYLIEQSVLDVLLELCAQHKVSPSKVAFSAHALYQATPIESPLHLQLYAGAEETFISVLQSNRLHSVKAFPFNPIERILTATEGEIRTPRQFLHVLDRRRGRETASQEAVVPAADAPATGRTGGADAQADYAERRQSPSESERMLYLYRFRADLEDIVADLNRFVRLHAINEPITLSVHGMFAPFLAWDAEALNLRVRKDQAEIHPPPRDAMGILEELRTHAQDMTSPAVVAFQRRRAGWWQALADLRRPLAVAFAAVALLCVLGLANLALSVSGKRAQLDRTQGDLAAALRAELRTAPADPAAGLRALRQQVEQARASQSADSRFADYDHDVLELLKELTQTFAQHPGLSVESMSYNAERFTLAGKTPSYNDSESLRNGLAQWQRFQGRDVKITHQRTAQDITFRISIDR